MLASNTVSSCPSTPYSRTSARCTSLVLKPPLTPEKMKAYWAPDGGGGGEGGANGGAGDRGGSGGDGGGAYGGAVGDGLSTAKREPFVKLL